MRRERTMATPEPFFPTADFPFWFPFLAVAAAITLVPPAVLGRGPEAIRCAIGCSIVAAPVAGLALASWASLDIYFEQLTASRGCPLLSPAFCSPPPDVSLLLAGILWGGIAAGLVCLAALTGGPRKSLRQRAIEKLLLPTASVTFVALLVAGILAILGASWLDGLRIAGLASVTGGFLSLGFASLVPVGPRIRTSRASRIAARLEGIVSITFAFVLVDVALAPPPVF